MSQVFKMFKQKQTNMQPVNNYSSLSWTEDSHSTIQKPEELTEEEKIAAARRQSTFQPNDNNLLSMARSEKLMVGNGIEGGPDSGGIVMQSNQAIDRAQSQQMVMLLDEQIQTGMTSKIRGFFTKKDQAPGQQMSQIPFL